MMNTCRDQIYTCNGSDIGYACHHHDTRRIRHPALIRPSASQTARMSRLKAPGIAAPPPPHCSGTVSPIPEQSNPIMGKQCVTSGSIAHWLLGSCRDCDVAPADSTAARFQMRPAHCWASSLPRLTALYHDCQASPVMVARQHRP